MSSRVRALTVTHVQPDQASDPPPSHADHDAIKLSLFDTLFIALTPVQRLFFYDGDDLPPFPALSRTLRSSLAATLAVFTPLAGKLTASSSGDVFIDCSPAAVSLPGVRFVEAEYAGGGDMRRLAGDAEHDAEAFLQLVPGLPVGELPAPVLAVQVTRPADGGGERAVMVGVAIHHAVADGHSVWQFMKAWSAVSRTASDLAPPDGDSPVPQSGEDRPQDTEHDCAVAACGQIPFFELPTGSVEKKLSAPRRRDPVGSAGANKRRNARTSSSALGCRMPAW